jgi:two-component system, OmpR family, sensor kinase
VSLRARILAGVALIAVVLLAVGVAITQTTRSNLVRQVDAQLQSAVVPVRSYALPFDRRGPGGGGGAGQLSSLFVGYVDGDHVQTLLAPTLRGEDEPLPVIAADEAVEAAVSGEPFTVEAEEGDLRYRVRSYVDERAAVVVTLALPLDTVDGAVADLVTVEVAAGAVVAAALGLMAWWVIHLGVRPINRMTVAASTIAAGDLAHRVPEASPGTEAGRLGSALNRMLGQIEAAFTQRSRAEDRLRQFVADASHELRTPVATIRGYAELYRAGALDERAELDDAMRRTEQEAIRMGRLVDDLLHLARLDQGRPLEVGPVDLAQLAQDAARDASAVDPERVVQAVTDGPLIIGGDEFRLRQVLANVVGNALVHTDPGTPIEIHTARDDGRAIVTVTDHGQGMAPEVVDRAFERFYRADPARSRHRGGSGLGLSIVEATVRAHGGVATIESAPGVGTTVRVELPIDPHPTADR